MTATAPGAIPSPNIWGHSDTYELENRAVDPDGVIEAAIRERFDWTGGHVLDIGCGTGFHLPRFAARAARVTGVEPHPELAAAGPIWRRWYGSSSHRSWPPGSSPSILAVRWTTP